MLFNTWEYGVFLVVVLASYFALGRISVRAQNLLLLVAGYVFYGWWDWRFLSLLAFSTAVDYGIGRWMGKETRPSARKRILLIGLVVNLGLLGFFKYFNFFIDSAATVLVGLGFEPHLPVLRVVLPVGISFYTFQSMAYTIDVYRRETEPVDDFLLYATYVGFFPQLVAGPIERAQHLLPQLGRRREVTIERFASGCQLILIGLFRKVVIADFAAGEVEKAFAAPAEQGSMFLVRAMLLFTLEIYGDFAGYSDIARGSARLLGVELMQNFAHPYFTTNITHFWRRWHISLSTWLRDYLYIPLGGSRGSTLRTYFNLLVTMLLGGLWHGASWTFVIWGGIHGAALSIHRFILGGRSPRERSWRVSSPVELGKTLLAWAATMTVVVTAWVFFRAPDLSHAVDFLAGIAALRGDMSVRLLALPVGLFAAVCVVDVPQWISGDQNVVGRYPWWLRGVSYASMILAIALLRKEDVPFIYFQF